MVDARSFSQMCLWVLSTSMGGFGIFCVWASFWVPSIGLKAILFLGTATAIRLGVFK